MEIVEVKIKSTVVTVRYGSLSSGDILRTDAAFAKHLVEDCGAADYVVAQAEVLDGLQTDASTAPPVDATAAAPTDAPTDAPAAAPAVTAPATRKKGK